MLDWGGGGGGRCHLFVSNSNLSLNWLDSGVADDKCWIGGWGRRGGGVTYLFQIVICH